MDASRTVLGSKAPWLLLLLIPAIYFCLVLPEVIWGWSDPCGFGCLLLALPPALMGIAIVQRKRIPGLVLLPFVVTMGMVWLGGLYGLAGLVPFWVRRNAWWFAEWPLFIGGWAAIGGLWVIRRQKTAAVASWAVPIGITIARVVANEVINHGRWATSEWQGVGLALGLLISGVLAFDLFVLFRSQKKAVTVHATIALGVNIFTLFLLCLACFVASVLAGFTVAG